MSQSSSGIARSKDGVPQWDGGAQDFQEYYETCLLLEASTPYHKRYLNGAKLANELTGSARKLILGRPANWLSSQHDGVRALLDYLRSCMGKPQLAEISEYLNRYFRQSRRRSGESMADYVTRAARATSRERIPGSVDLGIGTTPIQAAGDRVGTRTSNASVTSAEPEDPQAAAPVASEATTTSEAGTGGENREDGWSQWRPSYWGSDWGYSYQWSPTWWDQWYGGSWNSPSREAEAPLVELLPDYVQGWYLLQDSSLDVSEKNIIQTALRGDYSLQKVAQELRSQWPEADLKRRDQGARQSSFWGSIEEDAAFDAEDDLEGYDEKALQSEGMNEEGLVAMDQAHREAQEAYAIIQGARRTLKEARTKQKFVKLSRQYYSAKGSGGSFRGAASSSSSSTGGGSGRNDANMTCLACGKVGHRAANCPTRKEEAKYEEESAPFVCYADQNEQQASYHATSEGENFARGQGPMTTAEAMAAGIGIIDGGATKTLASVTALEQLMRRNEELRGNPGIKEVDVQTRPTFSFEQVHTIQEGSGPLLISVETLRSLGAVIDFGEDLAVFRKAMTSKITMANLKEAIMEYGERFEKVLKIKTQDPLKQMISQLNKAKKKKSQLQEFLN
ncbi:hypothetical protein AK812_SmicGene14406 [Symbiodinium microadriaticum]|uniref:CCHC-type domain-containing protein n=1 Tax=Symbiodinium microadriaticum TaxID=2951 RepID=A0A1Q9E5N2_SYMMI|nr:hypothetical protein AK812_SmicGene14406 [Symbiodinium microadriaticum]